MCFSFRYAKTAVSRGQAADVLAADQKANVESINALKDLIQLGVLVLDHAMVANIDALKGLIRRKVLGVTPLASRGGRRGPPFYDGGPRGGPDFLTGAWNGNRSHTRVRSVNQIRRAVLDAQCSAARNARALPGAGRRRRRA